MALTTTNAPAGQLSRKGLMAQRGFQEKFMSRYADLPEKAIAAIRSNFAMRNAPAFTNAGRQSRIRATRRHQIREWIEVLRVLRNPAMAANVADRLRDTGPLMAHDLRNRVIIAGLDYRIAQAKGTL